MKTFGGNGGPDEQGGVGIHLYAANRSMKGRYFYNADGELMLVPQQGRLRLATELGLIDLEPLEIAVIPRGVRFRVELLDDTARGYMLENFGAALRLPELGPIGSNCLANSRDFKTPVAWYEDVEGDFELIAKFTGGFGARPSAIRRWTWWPGTARTRPTSTTCATSTPSARSATTIPIRRSSRC